MNRSWPLAAWLASITLVAITAAMLAYGLSVHTGDDEATLHREIATHTWHAVVLVVPLYLCLAAAIRRLMVAPLRAMQSHLYRVATGRLVPLVLVSRVREIDRLVLSINQMIRRMQLGERRMDVPAIARQLKGLAGRLYELDRTESDELLRIADQLDRGFGSTAELMPAGRAAPVLLPRGVHHAS